MLNSVENDVLNRAFAYSNFKLYVVKLRFCLLVTGAVYGDGVYFATSASTSMKYCKPFEGLCYMYYCRVLVGDYTTGRAGIKEPPIKDIDTQEWFDSVVDNEESPSMFVIFNDTQVYPEYLLTFSNDPHDI